MFEGMSFSRERDAGLYFFKEVWPPRFDKIENEIQSQTRIYKSFWL